jgi:ATP-binding cassette subfamily F protein 3
VSLAVLEQVSLSYGQKTIVEELDLRLAADDRIGLIGPNGSGKTSILRLLANQQQPDSGRIRLRRGLRLGYLPQDLTLDVDKPLLQFVVSSVEGREALDREIAECEAELDRVGNEVSAGTRTDDDLMEVAERMSDLHERATHYDLHYTEHEATRILAGLGFRIEDLQRPLSELSGGWKMRAVLAALLFQMPDLLLLDEPTNHLDLPSVTWFADFLKNYSHAFILICHDREFLNEQIARVVSFEVEGVRQYTGDYDQYLRQRAEEEVILENKSKNIAREREQTERFINRFRAQANKARAVQSRVKQLAKMEEVETFGSRKVMRFKFPPCDRGANEVIRLDGVGKNFGERKVLSGVDLTVKRGEKVGIIGVNGAGKTTLLRMMAGEMEVGAGTITLGYGIKPGYYAQHHADTLYGADTVYDTVAREKPDAGVTRIRSVLGAFLFSGDDVEKKIGVLSGGERSRVALARLLINPGNLLLMDEPTNHLDLDSSEALAESLMSYDGTLVFVSHNRSFVRKLATRIWNVEGGRVETYPGTMDEYMDSCRRRQALQEGASKAERAGKAPAASKPAQAAQPARAQAQQAQPQAKPAASDEKSAKRREHELRQNRAQEKKLSQEIERLEREIATLETAQGERSAQLADPAVYADKARSQTLIEDFRAAAAELEQKQTRWERASTDLESLRAAVKQEAN